MDKTELLKNVDSTKDISAKFGISASIMKKSECPYEILTKNVRKHVRIQWTGPI